MEEFLKPQQTYLAKTLMGLETALVEELITIGASNVVAVKRGAMFSGDKSILYKANYCCRTAIRILAPIYEFAAHNEQMLYDGVKKFDWDKVFDVTDTFAINGTVFSDYFNHSHFVSLKAKDAIADQFRDKFGSRPSVDTENPDMMINVHIHKDKVTISLDSSGDSLHLRGYRKDAKEAPLNEVLAAGLVKLSGWKPGEPLIDFMCGSGTILSEAALIAENVAPGFFREKFGFEKWGNYEPELLEQIKGQAKGQENHGIKGFIGGCDHSPGAVKVALQNLKEAGLKDIDIEISDFKKYHHNFESGVVIINPPYGERLAVLDIESLYKEIGNIWKQQYKGFKCWMITSSKEGIKSIGLKPFKKIDMMNGALECKYLGFDIYAGSKKSKYAETEL
jgi:putative N6-adenine-specific DNA methylase